MSTLLICLFIASILPYLSKLPLAYAMYQSGGYNNAHPRVQQAQLTGFGARAVAAHNNSFEALLIFGIAVLAALVTQHVTQMTENLAIAFIVLRVIYHILYLANWPTLRSTVWAAGLACSLIILGACIPSW